MSGTGCPTYIDNMVGMHVYKNHDTYRSIVIGGNPHINARMLDIKTINETWQTNIKLNED